MYKYEQKTQELIRLLSRSGVSVQIKEDGKRWKVVVKDVRCVAEAHVRDYRVRLGYATGWWRLIAKPGKALYDGLQAALSVWERTTGEKIAR